MVVTKIKCGHIPGGVHLYIQLMIYLDLICVSDQICPILYPGRRLGSLPYYLFTKNEIMAPLHVDTSTAESTYL